MNREVNVTRRVKTLQGLRYCAVVLSANGRIRPDWVLVNGSEERHPEGAYYLEWREGTKRTRLSVGNDPATATARRMQKEAELNANNNGIEVLPYMMNPDGYVEFRELREGLTFANAALKYQPDFRRVVLWLVHRNGEAGDAAMPFVWRHAHAIRTRPHPSPDSLEYGLSMVDQGSVASPICEFIFAGIDRHNRNEEDIPLGISENCKKFMAIERQGRERFCSRNCGVRNFYEAQGGAAKYMRDLRQNPMYKKKQR